MRSASASSTTGPGDPSSGTVSSSRSRSAIASDGRRPGPDDERVVLVVEDLGERGLGIDLLDVVLGQRHRRRLDDLGGEQRLERLGHGERHEAGPGTPRGAAHEQPGAGVVERSGDHEQLPERALVAALRALRDEPRDDVVVEQDGALGHLRGRLARLARRRRLAPPEAHRSLVRHALTSSSSISAASARVRSWRSRIRSNRASSLPLAVVEPVVDVEREHVLAARRAHPERDRDRVVRLVGDRQRDPAHPQLLRPLRGTPVEADRRLAGRAAARPRCPSSRSRARPGPAPWTRPPWPPSARRTSRAGRGRSGAPWA